MILEPLACVIDGNGMHTLFAAMWFPDLDDFPHSIATSGGSSFMEVVCFAAGQMTILHDQIEEHMEFERKMEAARWN